MDLFGLKRRARERAANEAAQNQKLNAEVHAQISADLKESFGDYSASLLNEPDFARKTFDALAAVGPLQEGIDAVLLKGVDAYGTELAAAERHKRAGAMLAHGARNYICLFGSFDRTKSRQDFRELLITPRESAPHAVS